MDAARGWLVEVGCLCAVDGDPIQTERGEPSGLRQVLVQPLVSLCGDPVRVAAFVGWLGLDQGVALEPRERPVQVPGPSVIPANTSISLVSAYPCSSPRAKLVNTSTLRSGGRDLLSGITGGSPSEWSHRTWLASSRFAHSSARTEG